MKRDNPQVLILVGIPASGKSTWSKEHIRRNPDWVRVNRDDYRLMLKDAQMCDPKIESMISELVTFAIRKSLAIKRKVIVDATNLGAKYINEYVNEFTHEADIDFRIFDISLSKAIQRDNARFAKVGEEVIKKMYENYKILVDSYAFQPVKMTPRPHIVPVINSNFPSAYIFDIDGTISRMSNRSPFDWDKVDRDHVNEPVVEVLKDCKARGYDILLVSGRDEASRELTIEWLDFYGIPFDALYMRPAGSFQKDTSIKRDIYNNLIEGKYNIMGVFDDRLSVLEMWHKLGLFTFNVNQGNFEF